MSITPAESTDHRASVRVTEIFYSIQGEARPAGLPTAFVRLTGCPLRCRYCDTEYAFHGGTRMPVDDIVAAVRKFGTSQVCVTGGEPLAQPDCQVLLERLCEQGYDVSLETSGALDIDAVDSRVSIVLDLKTPGSGEQRRNRLDNLAHLKPQDQVKFVICDRNDYEWARNMLEAHAMDKRCAVLFSPAWGEIDARELAEWILDDHLPVRLQVQLHKYLWGEAPGH